MGAGGVSGTLSPIGRGKIEGVVGTPRIENKETRLVLDIIAA